MSDNDDLELQALQRQLDDAFETTRPRVGFEDELWSRMQARRPLWRRVREFVAALADSIREAPAVPAAAVAVVLIVAVGVGIVSLSGLHFGGGGSTATSQSGGAQYNASRAPGAADLGHLPAVGLYPGVPAPHVKGTPFPDTAQPGAIPIPDNLYFGPATLSWTGNFNAFTGRALVYRYQEPTPGQADQFAFSLGATPAANDPRYLGSYEGLGFTLTVSASWSSPVREPRFFLLPTGATSSGADPKEVASAFLAAHSLMPTWPNTVDVAYSGNQVRVQFLRAFQLPTGAVAYVIGGLGDRYGTDVLLQDGRPQFADGPLPVNLDSASYPLIPASRAIQLALASSPAGPQAISPQPVVHLDKVEFVYALAFSVEQGFYEPAYLFSGSFQYQGRTYVKRVLVPAVGLQ